MERPARPADTEGRAVKILMAFNRDLNPYVDVLAAGLAAAGCPVDMGTEKFWNADLFDHDVVHIQWPETLFDWRVPSAIEMEFLKRRLKEIHARAKIVYTLHNEVSHHANETNAAALAELYSRVQSECDVMVHLGEASRRDWSARPEGAGKRHVVIPIPVYDELYAPPAGPDREAARRQLGIPRNRKVVLAFGNFRYAAEKRLAADAVAALRDRRICLLAPKWHKARDYSFSPVHPMLALRSARKAAWAWRRGWKLGAMKIMADEDVARHFAAADVVFIPRRAELNSGNVPMGFWFGKAVAGPDCGNIGEWLRATGNPVFHAADPESVRSALEEALRRSAAGQGEQNRAFAVANWTTRQIGEAHAQLYRSVHAGR